MKYVVNDESPFSGYADVENARRKWTLFEKIVSQIRPIKKFQDIQFVMPGRDLCLVGPMNRWRCCSLRAVILHTGCILAKLSRNMSVTL